ncbi:conserved Plasmodium protein, unknown function [Plasmodium ovale]|uniref:Uncharacterized protein n=2 Tax=Plasmodium ovale TaxID=36330 RepID=A0A1A8VI37_PLAOA|nr:conserved Plasmodium protein, unknown function [Plasmodium ovale curtisi]SBS80274.1 conserved Plasmodium protein, unknown function [Plasmodium ovale curtisi]SCD22299.1 conserved Plasmodium protein, unknown function [Plasmodium ovale]
MNSLLKCLVCFALLNIVSKGKVSCTKDNDGSGNNHSRNDNNSANPLNVFLENDDNNGCTGEVEQNLINGEKFLKDSYYKAIATEEDKKKNAKDFVNIKTNQFREFTIHMFNSKNEPANDFYKVLFDCAKASSAKPYLIDICVTKYFKKYNISFSPTCLNCFSTFIGCTFISCNKQCAKDQCNNECKSCSEKNCFRTLLNCTKLDALPDPCK